MRCTSAIIYVVLVGCGPGKPSMQGESSESGESTAGISTTVAPTSSGAEGSSGSTSSIGLTATTSTGGSSTGSSSDDGAFIIDDDAMSRCDPECDKFEQDCPAGQKCMPYSCDGGSNWNSDKCVPVMENPAKVGEACFVVGNGVSGVDNCEAGAMCWDTDAEGIGYCIAMCTGSIYEPMCIAGTDCIVTAEASLILCLPICDPTSGICASEDVCAWTGAWFDCVPDESGDEGQAHDVCAGVDTCDPGLVCAMSSAAVECDVNMPGCCEPFCDLDDAFECPGEGQVCVPFFAEGEAPAGLEHIGFCSVP